MAALRPNDLRAKNAILVFWILMALEAITAVSSYWEYALLQEALNGEEVSEGRAALNDLRVGAIAILSLVCYITAIVLFIRWFRRACFNLLQLVNYVSFKENEAAYTWFVPILNLYRPFQIMRELYNETKYQLEKNSIPHNPGISSDFLGIWWAFWIINGIVGQVAFRAELRAEGIEDMMLSNRIGIASNVIGILATLAVIKVISDYAKAEPLIAQAPTPLPVVAS